MNEFIVCLILILDKMNRLYISKLLKCNRVGKVIRLIRDNVYVWSVNDFEFVILACKLCCHYICHHIEKESLYNDLKRKLRIEGSMHYSDKFGVTIEHMRLTIKSGHSDLLYKYIHGSDIEKYLYKLVKYGYLFMIKYYLLSGYDIDKCVDILYNGVHGAYRLENNEVIKYLTSHVMLNRYMYRLSSHIIWKVNPM